MRLIEGLTAKEEETSQAITTLSDELAALKKSIKDLDQAVTDATEQRKGEHKEYVETAAQNTAAVQLLEVAKNRMNKFYNPALYVKPVRRELTEEERIYVQSGGADPRDAEEAAVAGTGIAGTGIAVFTQLKLKSKDAPPPPPETVDAYTKKDASGPVALIEKKKNAQAEMMALGEYIAKLHGSCDFLLENFDVRKEARASEIDALKKAKAVLSGADYSLLQTVRKPAFLQKKH